MEAVRKATNCITLTSGKVVISRDVVFSEEASWDWSVQKEYCISVPLTDISTRKEKEVGESSLTQAKISKGDNEILENV